MSQATANLSDFAQVSADINAQYARRHGYGLVVARGEASDWVQDRDVRWSKVSPPPSTSYQRNWSRTWKWQAACIGYTVSSLKLLDQPKCRWRFCRT